MIIEKVLPNEPAYPLLHRGLTWWLDVETHLVNAQYPSMIIEKVLPNEPAYPLLHRGLTWWLDVETHLVVNSNVADKIIYLHGLINSSSHTLP
ncbi:hypothetical protein C4D60_Mb00t13360 [Musa balbisiana]|uniref:Uncharacterized protein n=1 Tax=Musa balbisiana TaxID=52838 RepID=A0A4S8I729_MUSBA|nr:hypothetical protein C4D60_Mb00t13360 [Musa balbisiana]